MKRLTAAVIFCLVLTVSFSEPRNALLIANGNYANFAGLKNPIPEANALADSLRQLGFNVTVKTDLSKEQMEDCLYDFQLTLQSSGGTAFFHYGGHAVQVNGVNYLIPADADVPDERRVGTRCVNLDEVMASMQGDTNIVILDACRNNPLPAGEGRSAVRGLQPINNKPKNSIIVYSAQAGSVAEDGVFTPVLTQKILESKPFTSIVREVRKEVSSQTNNKQSPGSYDELYDEIFLAGRTENTSAAVTAVTSTTTTTIVRVISDGFVFIEGGATCSSFYICDHEVTQAEYRSITGLEPSRFNGDNKPVENITWYDAIEYCNMLSFKEDLTPCYTIDKSRIDPNNKNNYDKVKWIVTWNKTANGYRLPTEAEWEWAAKGGNESRKYEYSGSDNLGDVAWYSSNSGNQTHDVKTKKPNELGLYDMSGNVWEWCWDWYAYSQSKVKDYSGSATGGYRCIRGGSWGVDTDCEFVTRSFDYPDYRYSYNGFRVVRSAEGKQ